MYEQVEKPKTSKERKSKALTNSINQMKDNRKQGFGFVDNRPEAIAQRKMQTLSNNRFSQAIQKKENETVQRCDNAGVIQLKTVTVTNNTNNYDSGWLEAETRSTGVEEGPQAEAQSVASIAGGTWVGGHMVNDRLRGHGGFGNIVPITASMNNKHHTVENAAQKIVGANGSDYEVRYYMNILHRDDYTFTPSGDKVNNLADKFQQHYDYRTKEVQAGGTQSRPIAYQAPGPITTVDGAVLDMD